MPTLESLIAEFTHVAAPETIQQAAVRAHGFVVAARAAGYAEEVTDALRFSTLQPDDVVVDLSAAAEAFAAALEEPPLAAEERMIAEAEARLGEPLPESLRELWTFLAHPARARLVRAVAKHSIVAPAQLVSPPDWASDAQLCCLRLAKSVTDARERFEYDYEEWYEESEPQFQVSTPADLHADKLGKEWMLDPARKQSIILLAYWHSEVWFILHELRSEGAPAPVFSSHDDHEGYSRYLATDVRGWFSWAISEGIRSCIEDV